MPPELSWEKEFDGAPVLYAATAAEWRAWLEANHSTATSVWLILFNRGSGVDSVPFADAVEQALCYGWIDSKAVKRAPGSRYQRFTPRNPKSTWSKVNRERAEKLIRQGSMTPHGRALVDLARTTGTWDALGEAQGAVVPADLQELLDQDEVARANFQAFPPSSRRVILEWIATAKRPETRQRRVAETVRLARQNVRANHPRAR